MHSMKGQNLSDVAAVISFAASRARPDEEDLIIAKVLFRYVSARGRASPHELSNYAKVGKALLDMYEKEAGRSLPDTPLMHFVRLALEALEMSSDKLLSKLQSKYSLALGQDPEIAATVHSLVSVLKPKQKKPPSIMDMFKLFA